MPRRYRVLNIRVKIAKVSYKNPENSKMQIGEVQSLYFSNPPKRWIYSTVVEENTNIHPSPSSYRIKYYDINSTHNSQKGTFIIKVNHTVKSLVLISTISLQIVFVEVYRIKKHSVIEQKNTI